MDYAKQLSVELEKVGGGHIWFKNVYFSLEELKQLSTIIQRLNHIDAIMICTYHIDDEGIMEAYWCNLFIHVVETVQDKTTVILNDTGRATLEELGEESIELWNNTYFEVQKGDIKGFIESLNQYISFMKKYENSLREECDDPTKEEQGIYYEIS